MSVEETEDNSMVTRDNLELLNRLGFGSDVNELEKYVGLLQDSASSGEPIVSDDVYDIHYKLLSDLKPDSSVLNRNWENEDNELNVNDSLLGLFGMRSIKTIKDFNELNSYVSDVINDGSYDFVASSKLNGHAIRAVYKNGYLVSGSTRGRYKKGRDITRHLKLLLHNEIEEWKNEALVEVRGEALISKDNFNTVKGIVKTPLSSVTSFIRESATDEEIKLLDVVCYKVLKHRGTNKDNGYSSLLDEYNDLSRLGFKVPKYEILRNVGKNNFFDSLITLNNSFSSVKDTLEYDTDGVVVCLNNNNIFYDLGLNGNNYLCNFALKVGDVYGTKVYQSTIKEIEWVHGKTYITPKAIIEPVKTSNGAEVRVVPLYNVGMITKMRLLPNEKIYFTFGGETGVSLCDSKGNKIS